MQAGQALIYEAQATVDSLLAAGELAASAAEQLEAALQGQAEKDAYLAETVAQQQNAIVQTVASFVDALGNGAAMDEDAAQDGEGGGGEECTDAEARARRRYTLACLRSFVRQYNVQVAAVDERLRAEVPGLPEGVLL